MATKTLNVKMMLGPQQYREYEDVKLLAMVGPGNEYIRFNMVKKQSDGKTVTRTIETTCRYIIEEVVTHDGTISI